ncbi:molybdenum cofactor guanylyltransferase [Arthrobacter bambusae]|uniref:molybdenum cofactor guanylyltransferase n=1 Tax=Arthrobacter bambusae TaxID=1338426 RepID=UPI00278B4823|nr:NTP transferase domain-containing protein [Arthrobacter bambusae]MDQ0211717.1 molybdopterin-guanine dinucleotide biosynthesis protein A [Arthrobacter bambusae]MDQ0236283.1 molybdopterin-guanine dinucleotide biosynthesis protein A [Arthrobacter bambusae]
MDFDAVVLAGGKSSRLGGVPKAHLKYDGATLLQRALAATRGARRVVVVGPDPGTLPDGTLTAREDPPFAGPAAAIAAGLLALQGQDSEGQDSEARHGQSPSPDHAAWVLVMACDMPLAAAAVPVLLQEVSAHSESEGALSISSDGRKQPLLGIYRVSALQREVQAVSEEGGLANAAVFRLLARLDLLAVPVPEGSTDDVDTWDDAAALGVDGDLP